MYLCSAGVDKDFEQLLMEIFGADFVDAFRQKRPAGWVDLILAFESRKRAATPFKSKPLNVSLPFSFTDYHQKFRVSSTDCSSLLYAGMLILGLGPGIECSGLGIKYKAIHYCLKYGTIDHTMYF